jgi:hypothetical protein
VIQFAPPLICDQDHFDEIEQKVRAVLEKAWTILPLEPKDVAEAPPMRPHQSTERWGT